MKLFKSSIIKRAYLKMLRHSGPPEYVARGVAIGFFTAFFIPFSVQMPIAFLLSLKFRAARISAMLFTWITNPLTIPFIYPLQCYVGSKLIHAPLSYEFVKGQLASIAETPSIRLIAELGSEIILSFFAGGLLFGAIAAFIGYHATLPWIRRHREKRELRRQRRKERATHFKPKQQECSAK